MSVPPPSAASLRLSVAATAFAILSATLPSSASVGIGAEGGAFRHVEALQEIATQNGGSRAAGTPGYDRSAEYVAEQLKAAGYAVRFEEFTFPFSEERSPPVLSIVGTPDGPFPKEAMRSLANSGSAAVTARLHAVDLALGEGPPPPSTSGCEPEDFAGFERGRIALVRRGTCPFQVKVDHAVAAGAAGVIIMNQGTGEDAGTFGGRLATRATVPVLGITTEAGRKLNEAAAAAGGVEVQLSVDLEYGTRATRNVIAERPGRSGDPIVVGAHLDSVSEGPGMNDNASGTAAVLAAALRLAGQGEEGRPVRFAFWGAEERGLIGSRHHVNSLPEEDRRRTALYINLDMVASSNFVRFVHSAGEGLAPEAGRLIESFFRERGAPIEVRSGGRRGSGSDDASFAEKDIPTVGLFAGAGGHKAAPQAELFGGTAGKPYDPCYHQACDTVANIDRALLESMADALTHVLRRLALEPQLSSKP